VKGAQTTAAQQSGQAAEDFALAFLQKKGFDLVERNFRCQGGELDLIMMDGSALVFIEVRYRRRSDFGDGGESIDGRKQRKLRIAAETWLNKNENAMFSGCRFDVMSVSGDSDADNGFIAEWIDDAF